MLGQDEFLEHIDKCLHKNEELRHHSNEHNAPFCMRYWRCKDCGKVLRVEDFSIGCNKHSLNLKTTEDKK